MLFFTNGGHIAHSGFCGFKSFKTRNDPSRQILRCKASAGCSQIAISVERLIQDIDTGL